MPPLPKKKHSRKRKGGRNAHNSIRAASLSTCPQCRSPRMPHRACSVCGTYNGRSLTNQNPSDQTDADLAG